VKAIRDWSDELGLGLHIEVDGGIKPNTARLAVDAGADLLVTGSFIYGSDNYQKAIATLRSKIA
jgi:ribulose-phosphate 3-epimerase